MNFQPSKMFDNANKTVEAYHAALQPLCKDTGIPPLALDILLYLANNPERATAKDACKIRGFKSGIVSVHIERLVAGGLIERSPAPEDRRRILLKVTPAATPIIEKGRIIQREFYARTLKGVGEDEIKALRATMSKIERNVDEIIAGKRREEEGNV